MKTTYGIIEIVDGNKYEAITQPETDEDITSCKAVMVPTDGNVYNVSWFAPESAADKYRATVFYNGGEFVLNDEDWTGLTEEEFSN